MSCSVVRPTKLNPDVIFVAINVDNIGGIDRKLRCSHSLGRSHCDLA